MTRASITSIVLIYLCMNLLLFVAGVRVIDNNDFLERFIDIDSYSDGNLNLSSSLIDSVPTNYDETRGGLVSNTLQFIDVIGAIRDFLIFLVNILFTPIGLFIGSGIPSIITLLVGVPLVIGGVIAFILLIRSG